MATNFSEVTKGIAGAGDYADFLVKAFESGNAQAGTLARKVLGEISKNARMLRRDLTEPVKKAKEAAKAARAKTKGNGKSKKTKKEKKDKKEKKNGK